MQPKNLLILSGVAGLFALAAVFALESPGTSASSREKRPLFEGLDLRVNDVARIEVVQGEDKLTIAKRDGTWILEERGGYPALLTQVKKAATFVTGLEIEEEKSARPEHHAQLGVTDPTAPDSESTRVSLFDASGAGMGSVIASKTQYRGRNQKVLVREEGKDQVYLCDGGMELNLTPNSWIEPNFLTVPADRVSEVLITHGDGEVVRVGRVPENPGQFALENVPPGRSEKYNGVANPIGTALASLRLEDVRPISEVDFTAEPIAEALFRCKDGLSLSLTTARFEDQVWVRVRPAYEAPEPPPAPAEGEEPAPPETDPAVVQAEVEQLATDLGPWAFALPSYKSDALARRLEDLLAVPAAEPDPEPDVETQAPVTLPGVLPGGDDPVDDPVEDGR